jgi:hypothetical protein
MATKVYFNGASRVLPGAYSTITSGEQNAPAALDYGKILIIDTGLGAEWGGGAGINGELDSGKDAVYQFDNISDYKDFLAGGMFWKLSEPLFFPLDGVEGVSTIYHVKAATTTAAKLTFTATGGGDNGGTFAFKCKDEGISANGILTDDHLDKGYGYTIETGVIDTDKWILKVWKGSWRGDYTDDIAYNEIDMADSDPDLVIQSDEFDNIQDLIDWANNTTSFGTYFELDLTNTVVTGTGDVDSDDVDEITTYSLAAGGTETYSTDDLDDILEAVVDLDYQFILCDKYGTDDYSSAYVSKIFSHVQDAETEYTKTLVIGGGSDEDEFTSEDGSLAIAAYFDSPRAIVVHSNSKTSTQEVSSGFRIWPSIYSAAIVLGRICGLAPQIPVTNKKVNIDGIVHVMLKKDQKRALNGGVTCIIPDQYNGGFKVLQGINTMQSNDYIFNSSGKSFSIQFERVVAQINRELVINSETELLNDENGVNANTLSSGILKTWTETYLQSRVATDVADNLLLSFKNVTVTKVDDYYKVSYGIVVNNEITKIFYTGYLFNS